MKRFKMNNVVARLQDYLGDPIDLYFLVLKKLDDDVYKFNRSFGCRSYRDNDGIYKGMIYREVINTPLCDYERRYNYHKYKSLKYRKRLCKNNTLRTQAQASRWYY